MNLKTMGGRRFLLAVFTLLLATLLVWAGKIADGVWATAVVATVGGFITGNVVESLGEKK